MQSRAMNQVVLGIGLNIKGPTNNINTCTVSIRALIALLIALIHTVRSSVFNTIFNTEIKK